MRGIIREGEIISSFSFSISKQGCHNEGGVVKQVGVESRVKWEGVNIREKPLFMLGWNTDPGG